MVNRNFDLSSISTITNSLSDKFMTSGKAASTKTTTKSTSTSTGTTMNNEMASILNKMCSSKSISATDLDYLKNLQRLLNGKNGMSICNSSNASVTDRILMASSLLNTSKKSEYKSLINKTIGSQLASLGYSGAVPKCVYTKVESAIGKLLGGLKGNYKLKLNLNDYLKNDCLKDIL